VDGDALAVVVARAAERGREGDLRIDDERRRRVEGAEAYRRAVRAYQYVCARDGDALAAAPLVDARLLLAEVGRGPVPDQRAPRADRKPVGARHFERDCGRIGAGCDDEVVLEPSVRAVEDGVDAWVDTLGSHTGEGADARSPAARVVAREVVAHARQPI